MSMYSDINMYSPTSVEKVEELNDIYQSIGTILGTNMGSRLFNPKFGSELEDLMFDIMNDVTAFAIYGAVIEAIQKFESRVTVDYRQTQVIPDYDNSLYYVTVAFKVNGMGDQEFKYMGTLNK